jgi:photosystem II stability/assembly factor-like uncharacterized protein
MPTRRSSLKECRVSRFAAAVLALMLATLGICPGARAHDPSAYGGLFRSRNLGGTWLNADVGLFVNAALTVALDPHDPNHLLMGTDTGLLRSQNGGRSWIHEAQSLIFGPVFAIAFGPDGEDAICSAPSGVFIYDHGRWRRATAPDGAAPARAIAFGATADRVYLLGNRGLFVSDDRGEHFGRVQNGLAPDARMTMLAVATEPQEILFAVIDGKLMASGDGGKQWRFCIGSGGTSVDTGVLDPAWPSRVWAASADQIYVSDDLGVSWRSVGKRLPEPKTDVRGIAADRTAATLVVTTHRGMYLSEDAGSSWALKEGNLPIHLEAGPLVRDWQDSRTLYAVYSLMPYPEVWRTALQGGSLLARVDKLSLAGGLAFIVLLVMCGALLVLWLERRRSAGPPPRRGSLL